MALSCKALRLPLFRGAQTYRAVKDHDERTQRAPDATDSPDDQQRPLERCAHNASRHVAAILVRIRRRRDRRNVPQEAAVEREQSALELVVYDREEFKGKDVDDHLLHVSVSENNYQIGQEDEGVVHQRGHDQVCGHACTGVPSGRQGGMRYNRCSDGQKTGTQTCVGRNRFSSGTGV